MGVFHEPSRFAFARVLEQHWRAIHGEYLGITGELVDWAEKDLYDEGWKVFALFDFPHGRPVAANVAKCPVTASLVETHVARHGAAGFSMLKPKTRIRAHEGYQGEFLRCHLGLKIPMGDCGLRVRDEVRRWEPGKVLIFDDRVTHESWNLTDEERVLLLIDFLPDS